MVRPVARQLHLGRAAPGLDRSRPPSILASAVRVVLGSLVVAFLVIAAAGLVGGRRGDRNAREAGPDVDPGRYANAVAPFLASRPTLGIAQLGHLDGGAWLSRARGVLVVHPPQARLAIGACDEPRFTRVRVAVGGRLEVRIRPSAGTPTDEAWTRIPGPEAKPAGIMVPENGGELVLRCARETVVVLDVTP